MGAGCVLECRVVGTEPAEPGHHCSCVGVKWGAMQGLSWLWYALAFLKQCPLAPDFGLDYSGQPGDGLRGQK